MNVYNVTIRATIMACEEGVPAVDGEDAIQKVLADIESNGYEILGESSAHAEDVYD